MNRTSLQNFPAGYKYAVTFSLTPPQQVKLSPLLGRRGHDHTTSCQNRHMGAFRAKMDNWVVKFGELTRTVATENVTISALVALFNIHNAQTCWLRGLSGMYVFEDENGSFPQLESFGVHELDVSRVSEIENAKLNHESSDKESSDAEFMRTAYRLATSSKSAKKGKRKDPRQCKEARLCLRLRWSRLITPPGTLR